jgi:hypothetical protein
MVAGLGGNVFGFAFDSISTLHLPCTLLVAAAVD